MDRSSPEEAKFMGREPIPWLGAREMRIELDKKSLFALASDTRLEMLKALQPMRRTVSQLSEELGIDKGAIHRHLKKMEEGGLVKRHEDHGFVYYGLTWKARDLMSPNENTRIVIVMSAMWVFTIFAALLLVAGLMTNASDDSGVLLPRSSPEEADYLNDQFSSDSERFSLSLLLLPAILASIAVVLALVALRKVRRPLQRFPEKSKGLDLPDQANVDD